MSNIIELPVSFGEALDKLSILEIKLEKIKDERRADVQVEYDAIYSKLKHLETNDSSFHYRILKEVNTSIWDMQDIFRDSKDEKEKSELCMKIIDENDRRFRIKSKLNMLFDSHLREQKGYVKRKAFFLGHFGLGDNLTCIGIVRYLSTQYEEVVVVCNRKYAENVGAFYKDDNTIKLHLIDELNEISPNWGCPIDTFISIVKGYDVYTAGMHVMHKQYTNTSTLPFCFYKDVGISASCFWTYFHVPTTKESQDLYALVKDTQYVFVHNQSSSGPVFRIKLVEKKLGISSDEVLYINANENIYKPGHKFYELAQKFVFKPLLSYKDTLINASHIVLSDSSLFCLAANLEIKTDRCFYWARNEYSYNYFYNDTYKFPTGLNRKIFKDILEI